MKTITIILGAFTLGLGLISCDKAQDAPIRSEDPNRIIYDPINHSGKQEDKKPNSPLTLDEQALKRLGLKPLEITSEALPPLPEPADPSGNIGLDIAYTRWDEFYKRINVNQDPRNPLIGSDEGWRNISKFIIWGYGRPIGILLGRITLRFDMISNRDEDLGKFYDKPYLPLTLKYERHQKFIDENSSHLSDKIAAYRFDSLTRLHGVVPGNMALHQNTPMPYDLRHMRIAHNGVDISSLFSIRYQDYKEVVRTLDYSKWYWRDVRVSDVGMDVLDWIFDSYFHIYPLTKDYPKFTIIFILKDGTVISREVEHRV